VKEDLEEHVAELFPHLGIIGVAEGIVELVSLFDEIWSLRVVCLLGVPLAAGA